MANFDKAYALTAGEEGYYVSQEYWRSHGNTRSGETYMGIDRKANPTWEGWKIIDAYKKANGTPKWNFRFPKELGLEELVKKKAKKDYWDTVKGDDINNQEVAQHMFEQVWGGYGGVKRMQAAINTISSKQLPLTGNVGNDTLGLLNTLPQDKLLQALYDERKRWIQTTGAKVEPKAVNSWLARLERFKGDIREGIESAEESISTTTKKGVETIKNNPIILVAGAAFIGLSFFMTYKYFSSSSKNV